MTYLAAFTALLGIHSVWFLFRRNVDSPDSHVHACLQALCWTIVFILRVEYFSPLEWIDYLCAISALLWAACTICQVNYNNYKQHVKDYED